MSGWIASFEVRAKISAANKGRKHTNESKQKMSEKRKNVLKSPEHIKNVSVALRGKPKSESHKKALSESHKKIKFNPEWGQKSGEARKKKVFCVTNGKTYSGFRDAALALNLDSGSISRVASGKYKHTKGYKFSYV
jgi:arginine/lysine/ornithine decarboxylase